MTLMEDIDSAFAEDAELARLHKIAACFKEGDKIILDEIADFFRYDDDHKGQVYANCLDRLQEAAKLAEDSCPWEPSPPLDGLMIEMNGKKHRMHEVRRG